MGKPDAPDDPFANYKKNDVTSKYPDAGGLTNGATADDPSKHAFPRAKENWSARQWHDIYAGTRKLDSAPLSDAGTTWSKISKVLAEGFAAIQRDMANIPDEQWSGDAAQAGRDATNQYVADSENLDAAVQSMSSNMFGLSDVVGQTKGNAVTPEEVQNYANELFKNTFPTENTGSHESVIDTSINKSTYRLEGHLNDKDGSDKFNEAQVQQAINNINNQASVAARKQMTGLFQPGVEKSDSSVPVFQKATINPGDKGNPDRGGPGPGPSPTGGSPAGPSPTGAMPTPMKPVKTPGTTPAKTTPANTNNPLSNLSKGLQTASGLGQNALSQAQNAAKQALSQLDKAKAAMTKPAGLAALQKAAKLKGAGGLGAGGGKGGGGGAKGGGGGSGALGKSLSALSKESGVAKALKDAATMERALAGRGATASGMGGPMGGGAGGARGQGGEDKEHKANKFLVTTRNGEEVFGEPIKAGPIVIKE